MGYSATSGRPSSQIRPAYGWAVLTYDRLYRFFHHLDTPASEVGPVLRIELVCSLRARRLPDGMRVRPGDRIGALHLNNARIARLHEQERSPLSAGLEFRRQFFASLQALAALASPGGPLGGVRAFVATTILHDQLRRLGFEAEADGLVWPRLVAAYQRALLVSLHPGARLSRSSYRRARRLWVSRERLLARFGEGAVPLKRRWSMPPAA